MDEQLDLCQLDSFLCRLMAFGLLVSSSSVEATHCFLKLSQMLIIFIFKHGWQIMYFACVPVKADAVNYHTR